MTILAKPVLRYSHITARSFSTKIPGCLSSSSSSSSSSNFKRSSLLLTNQKSTPYRSLLANPFSTFTMAQSSSSPAGSKQTTETSPELKRYPRNPIVWIDCEMTGLDVFNDHIIEICCIITDGDLKIVDQIGYESVIHQPKEIMDNMNDWCIKHHKQSGLTEKVLTASPTKKNLATVEQELLNYIKTYVPLERNAVLGGNTVHMDKFFMTKEFPKVVEHLHYRVIDVSTISEFCWRHNPKLARLQPRKKNDHTARADILESIAQLSWFKQNYFKSEDEVEFSLVTSSFADLNMK